MKKSGDASMKKRMSGAGLCHPYHGVWQKKKKKSGGVSMMKKSGGAKTTMIGVCRPLCHRGGGDGGAWRKRRPRMQGH